MRLRKLWQFPALGRALWTGALLAWLGGSLALVARSAESEATLLTAEEEADTEHADSEYAGTEDSGAESADSQDNDETFPGGEGDAGNQGDEEFLADEPDDSLIVEDVPPAVMDTVTSPARRRKAAPAGADYHATPEEYDTEAMSAEPEEAETLEAEQSDAAEHGQQGAEPLAADGILVEAAKFKGLQPGVSVAADVEASLGPADATAQEDGYEIRSYRVAPFKSVSVWLFDGSVSSIVVDLERPLADHLLVEQLGLAGIRGVPVEDGQGRLLGSAFPERGVLFNYAGPPQQAQVTQLILDSISAEPFIARAEAFRRERLSGGLEDLKVAGQLEPDSARVFHLRARLLLEAGRPLDALNAAEQAATDVDSPCDYQITLIEALIASAEFEEAARRLPQAVEATEADSLCRAQAHLIWGDLLANGPARDYQQAINHHLQAIKLAEPLKSEAERATRLGALEVLLDAHLAVANDVAWGRWKSKTSVVPQWHDQADQVLQALEELTDSPRYRLSFARGLLAADVGMNGALRATKAIAAVETAAEQILEASSDPLVRESVQWELGLALYDAMQAELARQRTSQALELGHQAIELLEPLLAHRQAVPGQAYLVGRLLFRIGSVYAVQQSDHEGALEWFERAIPLLEEPIPLSALADVGRQGETFVSIGVSFWETGHHEEALRLTSQGAALMEQAVREGTMDAPSLVVPYGNLSSMHRHLGHEDEADNYESLAAKSQQGASR